MSPPALVLFCKQPRLGYGKQRLAATIGAQKALQIAKALLDCALDDAATWPGPLFVAPTSPDESDWARSLSQRPVLTEAEAMVEIQCSGNLGKRLENMDARIREGGSDSVVFMGSDAPTLTETHFNVVKHALKDYDIVLADGADGGVTLMASRCGWPPLEDLPWSTARLGSALASTCSASGRSVYRFDGGHDLDDESDMEPLRQMLATDTRSTRQALVATLR